MTTENNQQPVPEGYERPVRKVTEQPKPNPIVRRFQAAGNRFMFEMAIELFYDDIIKYFREWLKPLTPETVQEMIQNDKMPDVDPEWFTQIEGWQKYIMTIKLGRVGEAIATARPDLAKAIMACGDDGGIWLRKLYVHLLECVDHPEKLAPVAAKADEPAEEMVNARCESCNKVWPVKRSEVSKIEKCPYCGAGANDKPVPPADNNEAEPPV